ncbi:protein O-mannosyl-transferase 2-like isoform X2 [Dendronephthya gigantea]|uniref:protein O-mannosyl-transferase 2-like isoform X2 n=1 Tax=Dendronephthya gigantea TaxID=151771 RepID=UPI00106B635D|nr:protein O-mannosyl-transferase 2-like isoform X2 [Dendronephthya gigantea]
MEEKNGNTMSRECSSKILKNTEDYVARKLQYVYKQTSTDLFGVQVPSHVLRTAIFLIVVLFTFTTRFYLLHRPKHICWDETHFGKHANFYIKGQFFFDVHPPLAKMTIAAAGLLTGYDGDFLFDKPGDQYGDENYIGMRILCAFMGALCIPLAYLIVWEWTRSTTASVISASFILFDTGCLTISQYILLDPILMFYIMVAVFCVAKFQSQSKNPWTFEWWFWLSLSGINLANAFSCKWVGLFVILWAGFATVADLWEMLGDLSTSLVTVAKHFMARALCLIALPAVVYLFWFAVHFSILRSSGPGDGFFSSAFQSTLKGNELFKSSFPEHLAYGSVVTLKNNRPGGALLHSHHHLYPEEHPPVQQQVTGYSHKDPNNDWLVKKSSEPYNPDGPVEYVKHNDIIRLEHVPTKRNLHSHPVKAPLSQNQYQVSCYGENGEGDSNDFWQIQIINGKDEDLVKTVKTVFRLIHVSTGCALHGGSATLPKWGWEQLEMTCHPTQKHSNTKWNVESHVNEKVPKASPDLFYPSFLESVFESHAVMAQTNSGFKPKEGEVTSQPWQWPINYRGQVFSGGDERVYLLGNPVIWWLILVTIALFCLIFAYNAVREKRGYIDTPAEKARKSKFTSVICWLLLGWALHYFPFFLMGRVLYFHHYFPAYLFSAMVAGIVIEYIIESASSYIEYPEYRNMFYYSLVAVVLSVCIVSFWLFHGLTYGMSGPMSHQENCTQAAYKWMDSWEI